MRFERLPGYEEKNRIIEDNEWGILVLVKMTLNV